MTAWLSQFFIHPAYVLPGAALISLPILIHLLNRLRFKRVKFAAMEFLLRSRQKNRRRLLLEQWLLLLLRILAVMLLVALIARPFLDPSQLLILQGEKAHHLVLIDDSGSMRDQWGETTAFRSGLELLRRIAAAGAARPGTQKLTVLLLSQPEQPLLTQADLEPQFLTELENRLETLQCTHQTLDLAVGLRAALSQLQSPAAAKTLHVATDYRLRDWGPETPILAALKEIDAAKIDVQLVRAVPEKHANLSIEELSGPTHVAAANVPLRLKVVVKNHGEQLVQQLRLAVNQDGQKLPLSVVIDQLEPGAEAIREFDVLFPTPGKHDLSVALPADALEGDNTRFLAVDVAAARSMLVIAGDLEEDDAAFLRDALEPLAGLTGYAPVIENVEFLRRQSLADFGVIYLLNVGEIPADALNALEEQVARGSGLVWFLGPQVRPAYYTEQLYRGGEGPFPAPLTTIQELTPDPTLPGADIQLADHPLFRAFQGQDNPFVDNVRVQRYFGVPGDWKPLPSTQVIGRLRNRAPLFLEHRFGQGKVITCLTSCGPQWNDLARNPSYVVLQLELAQFVTRQPIQIGDRIVGQPIEFQLDPGFYRPQLEIRSPQAAVVTRLNAIPKNVPLSDGAPGTTAVRLAETFRQTDQPGVYQVLRFRQDETSEPLWYAYNVPRQESDLTVAATELLRQRISPFSHVQLVEYGQAQTGSGSSAGQEIRDLLLTVLLICMVLEQILALRLGFHTSPTNGPSTPLTGRSTAGGPA